jgi:hypothetical protein
MFNDLISKQGTILICLIGIVGSAAVFTNSIFNNANAVIAAAIGSGMCVLFVALTAEILVVNLKNAIHDQKQKENDELISVVISRAIFKVWAEEKEKMKETPSEK